MHYSAIPAILCILVLLSCGCTAPAPGTDRPASAMDSLARQYPPPGELVQVNGSMMHIRCTGNGTPLVILEAGSTDCSLSWALVQENLSAVTRVCSYDRAGYGWSDPVPGQVTARSVTGRLHELLGNANLTPPFILAGHSLGGEYVRAYAYRYPAEVAGMVLVDPGSEWQMVRTGAEFTEQQRSAIAAAVSGLRANRDRAENGSFARNLSLVPVDPRLPAYEYGAYRALLATRPWFWEARAAEAESAFTIFDELQGERITSPALPVIVIASGNEMGFSPDPVRNAQANLVFRTLQQEIANQSPRGEYLVAPNTSHYIQLDRPDLVSEKIRSVIWMVRADSSGSR